MAIFGLSISTGNLATEKFVMISWLYNFSEGVFWILFWILTVILSFGVLGNQLADENGMKQISEYITSTAGVQLL